MKEQKIFDALTQIREAYIEEAGTTRLKKPAMDWKKWTAVAACVVLTIGISGVFLVQNMLPFGGNAGHGSAGREESSLFMSYAGPVFPLTLNEADSEITADRSLVYDFSLPYADSIRVWGAQVEDHYTLNNAASEEKIIKAIYPFAGNFDDLDKLIPAITVNRQKVSPTLIAGGYSGGFTGMYGENESDESINIVPLNSWEGYKALLKDGSYKTNAFKPHPVLSQPVTVYTFSDFEAPEAYEAATQAISFTIDPEKTTIMMYGFNGGQIGDDGFRRFSYFVPNETRMRNDMKLLIVVGDDIKDYTLQGYKNGVCEAGNELDGVSAVVTRQERVLSDVMDEMIDDFIDGYGDGNATALSRDLFSGAVSEFMVQYGVLSESVHDRYLYGMIEDIISEAKNLQRVFYLAFDVTIPAGGSAYVTADMHKKPSFDFAGSGSKNQNSQGYDMVTRLESNLYFDTLTAALTSADHIEIVRQNYGFNLSQGISQVTLDPATQHYYLEIRPVE